MTSDKRANGKNRNSQLGAYCDFRVPTSGLRPLLACHSSLVTVLMRKAIEITGMVQGVGFRPFVFRLATDNHLTGFITNTAAGVSIEVEGTADGVESFLERLPKEIPPLARITGIIVADRPSNHDVGFRILPSRSGEERRVLISPDVAVCDDCLAELFNPAGRRFRYPFINCTNCGPRYTIVRDIPYDRAKTSMAPFPMCPDCQREYDDPRDRRFHAQPNACWKCGPGVELWDNSGRRIEVGDPIQKTVELLAAGEIVAVKGLGGFHLAADAMNEASVARLRERKRRVEKPFAVMAPSLADLEEFCCLNDTARQLLQSPAHPIVLLRKKRPERFAPSVAPFNRDLGVFLPYTPLHHLLFAGNGVGASERQKSRSSPCPPCPKNFHTESTEPLRDLRVKAFPSTDVTERFENINAASKEAEGPRLAALVMTSGNISEEPIAIDNAEAVERLRGLADYFLVHNREILLRADDSVVRVGGGRARQVRRSRGYVPSPIFLKEDLPPVLAVGGELKNTICITRGREAFLSQHIGDLENLESYKFFESTVAGLKRILEVEPRMLAYDLHPDYFSTRWALNRQGIEAVGVQHHHAHIASCMAENQLDARVIGFALDGTGYGLDGNVWGGEVLACDYRGFERLAHLQHIPMPGGSAVIVEPRRMAIGYLFRHFGRELWDLDIPFVRGLDRRRTEALLRMIEHGLNCPLTSSTGRLFDAVAAIAGVREQVNYEAQAAIELEAAIEEHGAEPSSAPSAGASGEGDGYPFAIRDEGGGWVIDTRPMFVALAQDMRDRAPTGLVSRRFHLGLVDVLARTAALLRERTGLDRVCLSGGSFQNTFLSAHLQRRLEKESFQVFSHTEVPCGDGGISLGQAIIAAHRKD
ncbi:MAG: carbamoyltransferase HypF [Terriglobia bacterium]